MKGCPDNHRTEVGLLSTFLPPDSSLGARHLGLLLGGADGVIEEWDLDAGLRLDRLLGGADGVIEEWDLDAGLRLDRFCIGESVEAAKGCNVVALMAPHETLACGETDEVLVAAVNSPGEAGLAILRRAPFAADSETAAAEVRAWQLEACWPPEAYAHNWRHLSSVSRGEFLIGSNSLVALGQTSALGMFEVGLYDTALSPPRPLTACLGHKDFVSDVCAVSAQTFASVGLDASLLLWDIRVGLQPAARANFGDFTPAGLSSLAAAPGRGAVGMGLLLCGSLVGELCLFDARSLGKPLARPPSVGGAAVRLRLWEEGAEQVVAAVASSQDGFGGSSGSDSDLC